jgi:hypothetical protein
VPDVPPREVPRRTQVPDDLRPVAWLSKAAWRGLPSRDAAPRAGDDHVVTVVEDGPFTRAHCVCGWRSHGRRARQLAHDAATVHRTTMRLGADVDEVYSAVPHAATTTADQLMERSQAWLQAAQARTPQS